MLNLAINARDAMPAGGALTIRTFAKVADPDFLTAHPGMTAGRYAAFAVTDTGMGMSPEIRAHIFEPFFTTKEVGKGTGLGLAVVHGIVSQAGGGIDVTTAPGAGTTFTVYLPAAKHAPAGLRPHAGGAAHGAGESILVVEDEGVLRELLEVALTAHGFRVFAASDGDEALQLLESTGTTIDLLVTDMVMPGRLNGRALADAVRRRAPNVKVLFISGYIDDPAIRGSGFGHDEPWLQKPFSLAAIAQKARETLDGT
jgi:CheY-like chemotaxis protein